MIISNSRAYKVFTLFLIVICVFTSSDLFAHGSQTIAPCVGTALCVKTPLCIGRGEYQPYSLEKEVEFIGKTLFNPIKSAESYRLFYFYPMEQVIELPSLADIRSKIQSGEIRHIGFPMPSDDGERLLTNVPIGCLQGRESTTIFGLTIHHPFGVSFNSSPLRWIQGLDEDSAQQLSILVEAPQDEMLDRTKDIWFSLEPNAIVDLKLSK